MSAICGGGHSELLTEKAVDRHIAKYDNPDNKKYFGACIDCWCGVSFGYYKKQKKEEGKEVKRND